MFNSLKSLGLFLVSLASVCAHAQSSELPDVFTQRIGQLRSQDSHKICSFYPLDQRHVVASAHCLDLKILTDIESYERKGLVNDFEFVPFLGARTTERLSVCTNIVDGICDKQSSISVGRYVLLGTADPELDRSVDIAILELEAALPANYSVASDKRWFHDADLNNDNDVSYVAVAFQEEDKRWYRKVKACSKPTPEQRPFKLNNLTFLPVRIYHMTCDMGPGSSGGVVFAKFKDKTIPMGVIAAQSDIDSRENLVVAHRYADSILNYVNELNRISGLVSNTSSPIIETAQKQIDSMGRGYAPSNHLMQSYRIGVKNPTSIKMLSRLGWASMDTIVTSLYMELAENSLSYKFFAQDDHSKNDKNFVMDLGRSLVVQDERYKQFIANNLKFSNANLVQIEENLKALEKSVNNLNALLGKKSNVTLSIGSLADLIDKHMPEYFRDDIGARKIPYVKFYQEIHALLFSFVEIDNVLTEAFFSNFKKQMQESIKYEYQPREIGTSGSRGVGVNGICFPD